MSSGFRQLASAFRSADADRREQEMREEAELAVPDIEEGGSDAIASLKERGLQSLRPCLVSFYSHGEVKEEHRALFHFWTVKAFSKESMTLGGPEAQMCFPVAVVEYEDGSVHEVRTGNVRFLDELFDYYDLALRDSR